MLWLYIVGGIAVLLLAFLWWRFTSVARGARQRDEKIFPLLDPLGEMLAAGNEPGRWEIDKLAKDPVTRSFLYEMLKHFERLDLFPEHYRSELAQAEANLVYWMLHPNELQEAPQAIDLVETVTRDIEDQTCRFYVFRYQMPHGHWAGEDWLLGLAGPYVDNTPPYAGLAGAFSRCTDKYGEVQPGELVDWFVDMVQRKSGA
jgi:hypothetical protein